MVLQRVPQIQPTTIASKGVSCKGLSPKSQSSCRPRRTKMKIGSQTLIRSSTLPFPFLNPLLHNNIPWILKRLILCPRSCNLLAIGVLGMLLRIVTFLLRNSQAKNSSRACHFDYPLIPSYGLLWSLLMFIVCVEI